MKLQKGRRKYVKRGDTEVVTLGDTFKSRIANHLLRDWLEYLEESWRSEESCGHLIPEKNHLLEVV